MNASVFMIHKMVSYSGLLFNSKCLRA